MGFGNRCPAEKSGGIVAWSSRSHMPNSIDGKQTTTETGHPRHGGPRLMCSERAFKKDSRDRRRIPHWLSSEREANRYHWTAP